MVWLYLVALNTGALVGVSGGHALLGAGAPLVTGVQVGAHASIGQQCLALGTEAHRPAGALSTVLLTLNQLTLMQLWKGSHSFG